MKKLFNTFTFVILCICSAVTVNAQDGYPDIKPRTPIDWLVTSKGDTINCIIDEPSSDLIGGSKYGKYKLNNGGKWIKITPESVKSYYLNESKELWKPMYVAEDSTITFMPLLEAGKINLFVRVYNNGRFTGVTMFINKSKSDTVYRLKTNGYSFNRKERKNMLATMLMDNKQAYDQFIADDKFTFKQMRNIVHLYNTGEPYKN